MTNLFYFINTECLRKRARGDVTIISPGTGSIKINGEDINYFDDKQCREQVSDLSSILNFSINSYVKKRSNFSK